MKKSKDYIKKNIYLNKTLRQKTGCCHNKITKIHTESQKHNSCVLCHCSETVKDVIWALQSVIVEQLQNDEFTFDTIT